MIRQALIKKGTGVLSIVAVLVFEATTVLGFIATATSEVVVVTPVATP